MSPRARLTVRVLALVALVVPVAIVGAFLATPRVAEPTGSEGPRASRPVARASQSPIAGVSVSPAPPSGSPVASPSSSRGAEPSRTPSLAERGRVANTEDGWAITLPDGWLRLDPTAAGVARARSMSPELGTFLAGQVAGLARSGVSLVAIDPRRSAAGGESDLARVYLTRTTGSGPVGLSQVAQLTIERLKANPTVRGPVTAISVALPAGDAVKIAYRVVDGVPAEAGSTSPAGRANSPVASNRQPAESAVVQYLVNTSRGLFVLTMGSRAGAAGRLGPVFDVIANSFELSG